MSGKGRILGKGVVKIMMEDFCEMMGGGETGKIEVILIILWRC